MEKQLTMLIADDMEINRASLAEIFKSEYRILEADNGQAVLERLAEENVSIVILDLCMPVKNGFEVIREMKQDERFLHIPIVAKTAIDENSEVKALEIGADEYIFSPCNPSIIKKRVHNIVQKYILEKEKMKMQLIEEQQMNKAKELFLARMSHELRTPISSILGIAELAHYKDAKVQEDFRKIKTQAQYLLALVNDVLDMAAADNGKMTLHQSVFDLNTVVSEVSDLFFTQCRKKKIEFNFQIENVTQEHLNGDVVRLKQVLINLLSNAFKFTEKGGRIDVKMSQKDTDDNNKKLLLISVSDTGCGISENVIGKIWRPFEQEYHANGKQYGGSGLGLSITKNIVELMNGTIEVDSKVGIGTQFYVAIPFEVGTIKVKEKRNFKSLKVFLIHDEEIAMNYMKATLARLGVSYDSEIEEDAIMQKLEQAYKAGQGFDICFIYWHIPNDLGKRLTRKIREKFDHDTLKIVTSAYNAVDYEKEMRAGGADYILNKPALQSQIYQLLSQICSASETEKEKQLVEDYDFSGKRVLLAEDNAVNAEVLTGFLKRVNLQVDHAENGKEALKRYESMPDYYYDMLFLDLNMPIMDGYEAAEKIREANKADAQEIPIAAVTADIFAEGVVKVHKAGMNDYVTKPIDCAALYQTIEKYLS